MLDFACGGKEAIDGQTHRIDVTTFLFNPARVRWSLGVEPRGILRKRFLAGLGADNAMTLGSHSGSNGQRLHGHLHPDPAQLQSLGLTSWPT